MFLISTPETLVNYKILQEYNKYILTLRVKFMVRPTTIYITEICFVIGFTSRPLVVTQKGSSTFFFIPFLVKLLGEEDGFDPLN